MSRSSFSKMILVNSRIEASHPRREKGGNRGSKETVVISTASSQLILYSFTGEGKKRTIKKPI
jgi:hypothetical protein